MTIAASTTFGIVKNLHLTNDGGFMACDNHLCNTLTIVDNKVLVAEVDQYISIHISHCAVLSATRE